MTARAISKALRELANPDIAEHSKRFFKTGKGEYGEGDKFLGIRVPLIRRQAKQFRDTSLAEVGKLLESGYHEERLCAVLILVLQFDGAAEQQKKAIYELYLSSTAYVNNWDLVDSSAHLIVGPYLERRSRRRLYKLARSTDLWERRIAIMATYHFIRNGDFDDTLALAELLLHDDHDLIHKAVGWMLREVGNRDRRAEEDFLESHYREMPRTMLRYAIEKLPERRRQAYLKGRV